MPLLMMRAANRLGRPFGVNPFPRAFPNPLTTDLGDRSQIFDRIFTSNFWGSDESRSGVGSEQEAAAAYLVRLRALLTERGLKRMFDAPCGDLNWIAGLARDSAMAYAGGDISAALVASLKSRFGDLDVRQFDICTDDFPAADAWHCRDCLFHLPFADIRMALERFACSTIPYALLTTHKAWLLHRNLDVEPGGFRYLDLERPPIGLPPAGLYLKDYRLGRDFPRFVGLWRREAIAAALDRPAGRKF